MQSPRARPGKFDGRWLILLSLLVYAGWIVGGGPDQDRNLRWKQVGVLSTDAAFMDLSLFPAAQTTLAQGGDPYVANPADQWQRTFNYPRLWLTFMRFPATPAALATVGLIFALAAMGTWLGFLGRLTLPEGLLGALIALSPAVMLGVNRGNTDLVIFTLIGSGAMLYAAEPILRRGGAYVLWLIAALLKLYPVLIFFLWLGTSAKKFLRQVGLPLALLGLYILVGWQEVVATLRNTATAWVLSYGARVPAKAMAQALAYFQTMTIDEPKLGHAFTLLAVAIVFFAARAGWRNLNSPVRPTPCKLRFRLGFLSGGVIYLATFIAGNNFDYRLIFLLLTVPWLWQSRSAPGMLGKMATVALIALIPTLWLNYFIAGWTGFILNQLSAWSLLAAIAVLLPSAWLMPLPRNGPRAEKAAAGAGQN